MPQLTLSLLGPLQAQLDGQPLTGLAYEKVRALLAYLVVEARPHGRDALCELLWPDQPGAAARRSLRVALTILRQALGDQTAPVSILIATRDSIQVNPAGNIALDLAGFTGLLRQTAEHRHVASVHCAECATHLAEAVELYRGEFLQGLAVRDSTAFEEWVTLHRERLHRQALDALTQLTASHEGRGEDEQARHYAWRTLTLEAWDEAAHRCLMRVLARKSQRSAALAQYERCRKVLEEQLGVVPSDETTALYEQIRSGTLARADTLTTPPTSDGNSAGSLAATEMPTVSNNHSPPHNLPAQLTSFVGRAHELVAGAQLLAKTRLLTLTGPGGTGKTRLALQLADAVRERFPNGVWCVDLAPIGDPELVLQAIMETLSLKELSGQAPLAQLSAYLREKRLLLLLDNFEQVVVAAPQLAKLLAGTAGPSLLVTSREVLRIRGEQEYPVQPLELPPHPTTPAHQRGSEAKELVHYPAIQLFVARAQAARPDFVLTDANAAAVAEICVRLDGLPLALELAAARVKLFAPQAMVKRLESRLQLLTNGARDMPARQRTLRATIDWSYQLLSPAEQALFRRLGVFMGGWTLDAVTAVCDLDSDLGLNMLDRLQVLVDHSLIKHHEEMGGEPRFTMLETLREYALEQLVAAGEAEMQRRRHANYFLALAERAELELQGAEQLAWRHRIDAEYDNLRAVLEWSQATTSNVEMGLRLAAALWLYWWRFSRHLSDGRQQLTRLVAHAKAIAPTEAHARALFGVGLLAGTQGDFALARARLTESQTLSRALEYPQGVAYAVCGLGVVAWLQGEFAAARAFHAESLALFRKLGERWPIALSLFCLGVDELYLENYERAAPLLEESLQLFRALGDQDMCGATLLDVGYAARMQGDNARAAASYAESLALFQDLGNIWGIAAVQLALGYLALAQGDVPRSAASFAESIAKYQELGHQEGVSICLAGLAGVAGSRGEPLRAARLFGAAAGVRARIGALEQAVERAVYERTVASVRAALGDAAFAAAWAAGRAMTLEQAIDEALHATSRMPFGSSAITWQGTGEH